MALALFVRNCAKPNMLKNLAGTAQFSQFTSQTQKTLSLTQKCSQMNVLKPQNIKFRNISLSAPRKSAHGDHRMLWTLEKALSASLLAIVPAAIAYPNPILDNLFAISMVIHFHWGIEACVVDYVRPILFGNAAPKIALAALYLISFATLGGLLYFNYHDIGLGKAIRKVWSLKAQ